jgi:hypothetical protein
VVVISEERGGISLCFNGNIVRNLDAASLRTALLGLLTKQPRKRRGRRGAEGETTPRPSQAPRPPPPLEPGEDPGKELPKTASGPGKTAKTEEAS